MLVHVAFFDGNPVPYYFVNVTNLSRDREVEVTHVWFPDVDPQSGILLVERPLPVRQGCDESWEAWIELARLGDVAHTRRRSPASGCQLARS